MKIEVGKSYRSRDGQKVMIASAFSGHGDEYPYIGTWRGQLASYSPEGRSGVPLDTDREWDLIAEWQEPAPAAGPEPDPLRDLVLATFENPESWPMTDGERIALLRRLYRMAKGGPNQ